MSWVGRIWRRVAGSRNRCMVECGRHGREKPDPVKEREENEDRRHVNPTTLVSGMYHVIVPSPTIVRAPFPFSPLAFFFYFFFIEVIARCSTLLCPFGVPLCTQLRFSRHSWLLHEEFHRCFDRFRAVVTFNFYAATYSVLSTRFVTKVSLN